MQTSETARLTIGTNNYDFPVVQATTGEKAIDISKLRAQTGYTTIDDGLANTAACTSEITYIDGEKGILEYRGIPIETLAENSTFIETAYLIIYGNLPTRKQMSDFSQKVLRNASLHEAMMHFFDGGFPFTAHPMAILSAMLNSVGCYYPHMVTNHREQDLEHFNDAAALLLSKVRTIAAMAYRMKNGLPMIYPKRDLGYSQNFLHMMFTEPYHEYYPHDDITKALDLILLLHGDHEQNCSTSTVRVVASSGANLFSSVSAGVCALWGPLHGGANQQVIQMLEKIHQSGGDVDAFIAGAKKGDYRLMGFGHRLYKTYDPRAKILRESAEKVLQVVKLKDPLLDIAQRLEEKARADSYFIDRNLYPNVDFYSGLILKAIGIPVDMFTVMFAIGRMPGWIAHWYEVASQTKGRITRPRQIYTGYERRDYIKMRNRDGENSSDYESDEHKSLGGGSSENASARA
ncbi:MAG: citrate synthase [Verrucomicrobiaceae bacterium]|nr:citrate synthase [Verrucomicrobiaceae bacterium]